MAPSALPCSLSWRFLVVVWVIALAVTLGTVHAQGTNGKLKREGPKRRTVDATLADPAALGLKCTRTLVGSICTDKKGERCDYLQLTKRGKCDFRRDICPKAVVLTFGDKDPGGKISPQPYQSSYTGIAHPCLKSKVRAELLCKKNRFTPLLVHVPRAAGKLGRTLLNGGLSKDWRMQYYYYNWAQDYDRTVNQDIVLQNQVKAGCPLVYVTFLRDPMERAISEWFTFGQSFVVGVSRRNKAKVSLLPEDLFGGPIDVATADPAKTFATILSSRYAGPLDPGVKSEDNVIWSLSGTLIGVPQEIFSTHWKPFPNVDMMWKWMEAYMSNPATANVMTKMLLGHPMYSTPKLGQTDADKIKRMMDCFGSYRQNATALAGSPCEGITGLFAGVSDNWPSTLDRLRLTLGWNMEYYKGRISSEIDPFDARMRIVTDKLPTSQVPPHIKQIIKDNNKLDQQIYDYAVELLKNSDRILEKARIDQGLKILKPNATEGRSVPRPEL